MQKLRIKNSFIEHPVSCPSPKDIEKNFGLLDEKISELKTEMVRFIDVEKELIEFEILSSVLVKPQTKIHKKIKLERRKAWEEALRRSKENEEKAIEIFDDIYLK